MKKIKIGVLCPSEIAFRRFMPALMLIDNVEFIGIAHASEEEWFGNISPNNNLEVLKGDYVKALKFVDAYGGKVFDSFEDMITSKEVDGIYIPLPPALHYKWAIKSLENGKHVFVEKPTTTNFLNSSELVSKAKEKGLALHENYMFNFHNQINEIESIIRKNTIGDIRLIRIAFGFPFRGANDFRYNKSLGGGALLDCGGYTIKLATRLLGDDIEILSHTLNYVDGYDVDIYGSGTIKNKENVVAQVSFGMDNSYKCDLEIWGSKGSIFTGRILTAPSGYKPEVLIKTGTEEKKIVLNSDDSFLKSICYFIECINKKEIREESYNNIMLQARLLEKFMEE